jgi:hypothetical protein
MKQLEMFDKDWEIYKLVDRVMEEEFEVKGRNTHSKHVLYDFLVGNPTKTIYFNKNRRLVDTKNRR